MRRPLDWFNRHEDLVAKTLFVSFILLSLLVYFHYGSGGCLEWDTCGVGVSP